MPDEREILAVFKADIEQYKAQIEEMSNVNTKASTSTDAVTASTDKLSKKSKGAAGSISTLSKGLAGVTGLLGVTGRLLGVNTDKIEALVFASQQFVRVGQDIAKTQKLAAESTSKFSLASAASIPIIGAIVVAIGAAAAILIRYQDQLFGVTEAQKAKMKADDGALISDEKLRASYNESIKTIKDLGIEYRLVTGQITEYQATIERLQTKNKDAVDQIQKDTKVKVEEIIGFWGQVRLAAAQAVGLGGLETQKVLDDLGRVIDDRNAIIKKKGEELTEEEKVALAKRFAQIDADTQRLLKANQDRLDKEKDARKKASEEALKELREFQKERNDINIQAAEDNLVRIRTEGEAARKELEDQQKKDNESTLREAKAFFDFHDKEDKRLLDDQKKRDLERIESAQQVASAIFDAYQQASDKRQELLDKEITQQEKNIDVQRDLAARGLDNTLAFEQKRAADLQRQQQKEAQQAKRVKLLETFLNSLAEFSKTDPKTALQKALLQVALAQAATAVFAEEGGIIGEIGERSNLRRKHKGGGDVLLHAQTGEGILSRREMDNLGRRNFHLLKDAARFPVRDDVFAMPQIALSGGMQPSNADVVKELRALRNDFKNQPREKLDINKYGEYIHTVTQDGITTATKGKLKKNRFKS